MKIIMHLRHIQPALFTRPCRQVVHINSLRLSLGMNGTAEIFRSHASQSQRQRKLSF